MIYSISQHKEVPVLIDRKNIFIDEEFGEIVRYNVYDDACKTYIGYVDLKDTANGAKVLYIKNDEPKLYKHFGQLADQIEVEHCLKRGIDKPYIHSVPARETYVKHFLRGKRFINEGVNVYLDYLTKNLIKGEKVMADFLGRQKIYMPINMINNIKEKIIKNPLLK